MTTFCQAKSGWLERAIDSVLDQTHQNFEFIIYDDASYDGTAEILGRYTKKDSRIRIIRGNKNVNSVSKSLGICFLNRHINTEVITWMFDDNILHPNALSVLCNKIGERDADVVYGQTKIVTNDERYWFIGKNTPEDIKRQFDTNSISVPNAGILIRPEVFNDVGWYDQSVILRRSCDWDLFRRIWSYTKKIEKVEFCCATEFGELSDVSLRNSFDTSFDIMKKYIHYRDILGFRLDILAAVYGPSDMIPLGDWTEEELYGIYRSFVRYFVSIGNLEKGFEWSRLIVDMRGDDLLLKNARVMYADKPEIYQALLAGVFSGRVAQNASVPQAVPRGMAPISRAVAQFLRGKISSSDSTLTKAGWRFVFRALRALWIRRPRLMR